MQRAQSFLGFLNKSLVALESVETNRVVNVEYLDAFGLEPFAKQHILIAIALETLVERVGQHDVTVNHEIRGVEIGIG